jgi:hypothetical protein
MLHSVEVGSFRGDLISALSNMMTRLYSRGSQPVIFPAGSRGTALRLGFSSEGEALAFVCAFGGHVRSIGDKSSQ